MYKAVKEGKGGIIARVVADSVSEEGDRITTFELEYHRFIHAEVMTHRMFSRNAMSSRAVPVKTLTEQVRESPATPIHWGKNQAGMQAKEELTGNDKQAVEDDWLTAARCAADIAKRMEIFGTHKQIVNRLLEPFQMMKVVLTATEFDNFFWLRLDPDAQPEIQELAKCMYEAMRDSQPELLRAGEWHTPYVGHIRNCEGVLRYCLEDLTTEYVDNKTRVIPTISAEEAKAISSSCCAQVSYRRLDNTYDKAMSIYERLGVGGSKIHASPFEHIATPMKQPKTSYLYGMDLDAYYIDEGVTHVGMNGHFWSGNLKGWIQYRQTLPNHTCWEY